MFIHVLQAFTVRIYKFLVPLVAGNPNLPGKNGKHWVHSNKSPGYKINGSSTLYPWLMKKCRDALMKNMMLSAAKDYRNDDFACQTSLWMIANFHIILRYWCWHCGVAISMFFGGFFPCASWGICTVLIPIPTLTFKSMIFLFRRWDILGGYFKMKH